eukprot:15531310-Heterocapsa_arctica.AAC.1
MRGSQRALPAEAGVRASAELTDLEGSAMTIVLDRLRALPEVNGHTPPIWVPRSQQHRAGL